MKLINFLIFFLLNIQFFRTDKIDEQRQIFLKEYGKECSDFKQNDNTQWPISAQNAANLAKNMFNLQWSIKTIVKVWKQNVNSTHTQLLPEHYKYEIIQRSAGLILIFFLALVCSCLCCCQVFCIPKFKLFARCCYIDIQTDTKSNKEKYFLFFSLLFTAGFTIFTSGLAYYDKEIQQSSQQLRCTSLWMIITTLSQNNKFSWVADWQGVNAIDNQIIKFATTLNDSMTQKALQQIADINTSQIQIQYSERNDSIYLLYNSTQNKTLINPNPLTFQDVPNVSSSYIQQLGPVNHVGTITFSLNQELQTRQNIIYILEQAANISQYLINQTIPLQLKFLNTKEQLDQFSLNLIKFLSKIESKINDRKWIIDSGVEAFKNYLILVVLFCFLCLASFCLVTWARFQKLAFLLHISWIALDVFLLIGLLIIAFVYYASVITDNVACNLSNQMIQDDNLFQLIVKLTRGNNYLYDQANNKEMIQLMKICLYNKGDLLSYFQLSEPVQQVSKLNQYISILEKNHPQKNIIQSQIKFIQGILQNYGQAIQQETQNSINNPNNVLKILNQWTNFNGVDSLQFNLGKCRVSQDEWEWNDNNCQYKSYYVTNSEPDYEFGWTICLNFDEVPIDFAEQRYSNPLYRECNLGLENFGSVQNASIQYHSHLRQYILSVKEVFSPILLQLKDYQKNLDQLDNEIQLNVFTQNYYYSQIQNVSNSAQQLNNIFEPITTGIIQSMNCSFIQDGFNRIKNSFCITLQDGLFLMYIYLISICSLLTLKIIFAVWSAMRCIPKNTHIVFIEEENNEQQGQNRIQQY